MITCPLENETKEMYKNFFRLAAIIIFQNMITFSVNVADNIMLGSYDQIALSSAASVNQVQFLFQQISLGLGEGLVTLSAQYWGRKEVKPIYQLTKIALIIGLSTSILLTALTSLFPVHVLKIFTTDPEIISSGCQYLAIMRFTYIPFIITNILLAALRSMEKVKIGFYISCISLIINIMMNYIFIFGKLGAPSLGVTGAAIGTLTARIIELLLIIIYIKSKFPDLFCLLTYKIKKTLLAAYVKSSFPIVLTQTLFGLSVSLQTAILGHLSSDAIAANSAATAIFQYLKLIAIGFSSATVVTIGKTVGSGKIEKVNQYKRSLQWIYLFVGLTICLLLNLIKTPLISLYSLTPSAKQLTYQIITLLSITAIGTSYQMPVNTGIIRGSGDTGFALKLDLVSIWVIMYPVSLLAAFVWKLPIIAVVGCLNSDQVLKCLPAFIKVNKFFRIHTLSMEGTSIDSE